jgi:hypothetical protein
LTFGSLPEKNPRDSTGGSDRKLRVESPDLVAQIGRKFGPGARGEVEAAIQQKLLDQRLRSQAFVVCGLRKKVVT